MDLRNWEFYEDGNALVGATVKVRDAVLTHPNAGTVLATTTTDNNGAWAFTGLTDVAKDVEVIWGNVGQSHRWYKGMTRHNLGAVRFFEAPTLPALSIPTASLADLSVTTAKLADLNVTTGKLANNAITAYYSATGSTGSPTTTSGTPVDLAEMTVTFTPVSTSSLVRVDFVGTFSSSGAGNIILVDLLLDGSLVRRRSQHAPVAAYTFQLPLIHYQSSLSVASHTFKMQWWTTGGTATAESTFRDLGVLELKK